MKKSFVLALMMLIVGPVYFAGAQSANVVKSIPMADKSTTTSSINFQIAIPELYAPHIIRENDHDAVNFSFKKSDGTTEFLFQVNKIAENQWPKIKDQLQHPFLIDHR